MEILKGHKYVTREDRVVEITQILTSDKTEHPVRGYRLGDGIELSWTTDGRFNGTIFDPHPLDIIREFVDSAPPTPTKPIDFADRVNHPSHYNKGKIEVIEFIEDQQLGYHLGNAVKYICRAGHKDPAKIIEDLEKSIWYTRRQIEKLKAEKDGRASVRPNEMPQERSK